MSMHRTQQALSDLKINEGKLRELTAVADTTIANESTANGSDLATTQALANALKTKLNALLTALRAKGIID
jgi:hypothetical protein